MKRANPRALSDEELALISAPAPGEEKLFAVGCLGTLVTPPLLLFASLVMGDAVWPFLLATLATLTVIAAAHGFLSFSRKGYRDELAYRSGRSEFSHYVTTAQETLGEGAANWIVLFTASNLPHGDYRWLRIEARDGAQPTARADLRISARGALRIKRMEIELSGETAGELLAMLRRLDPTALTNAPGFVYDGTPCNLAVLANELGEAKTASCNLCDEQQALHPTFCACSWLYDFTVRLDDLEGIHGRDGILL